jgi:hypothetical protein
MSPLFRCWTLLPKSQALRHRWSPEIITFTKAIKSSTECPECAEVLEARAGIGRFSSRLRTQNGWPSERTKQKLQLLPLSHF